MEKIFIGLLALSSITAFAVEAEKIYCGKITKVERYFKKGEAHLSFVLKKARRGEITEKEIFLQKQVEALQFDMNTSHYKLSIDYDLYLDFKRMEEIGAYACTSSNFQNAFGSDIDDAVREFKHWVF